MTELLLLLLPLPLPPPPPPPPLPILKEGAGGEEGKTRAGGTEQNMDLLRCSAASIADCGGEEGKEQRAQNRVDELGGREQSKADRTGPGGPGFAGLNLALATL